jgi:hypothetical protein
LTDEKDNSEVILQKIRVNKNTKKLIKQADGDGCLRKGEENDDNMEDYSNWLEK